MITHPACGKLPIVLYVLDTGRASVRYGYRWKSLHRLVSLQWPADSTIPANSLPSNKSRATKSCLSVVSSKVPESRSEPLANPFPPQRCNQDHGQPAKVLPAPRHTTASSPPSSALAHTDYDYCTRTTNSTTTTTVPYPRRYYSTVPAGLLFSLHGFAWRQRQSSLHHPRPATLLPLPPSGRAQSLDPLRLRKPPSLPRSRHRASALGSVAESRQSLGPVPARVCPAIASVPAPRHHQPNHRSIWKRHGRQRLD
jgi:hypothetical protein